MAQNSGLGEFLPIALLAGAAWFIYETFFSAPATLPASSAATGPTVCVGSGCPGTPSVPAAVPQIVIPAGFTVTPDVNNSWKGTVTYNGSPTSFNLVFAGGAPTGQVFNSAGADVTTALGAANVATLTSAFQQAATAFTVSGGVIPTGMGQFVRVPMMLRRMY